MSRFAETCVDFDAAHLAVNLVWRIVIQESLTLLYEIYDWGNIDFSDYQDTYP